MKTNYTPEAQALALLSEVSLILVGDQPFRERIQSALAAIGLHTWASRVYVFLDSEDGRSTSNAYEWCAGNVSAKIDGLQNIPYASIPSWKRIFQAEGRIYSENITELPMDLQELLGPLGVLSLVVYPLFQKQKMCGFVGFDECIQLRSWNPVELEVLRTLSGMLSGALERQNMQESEQLALLKFTKLFKDNPALMAIRSLPDLAFTEVNDAFVNKLGYARSEVIGKTGTDLGLFIYPEQKELLLQELDSGHPMLNIELALRCKDGRVLRGLLSGEMVKVGEKQFFLAVMADISAQYDLTRQLARERQRLQRILDSACLGTWEWNILTGIMSVNERWATIAGYRLQELQPVNVSVWNRLVHPEDLLLAEKKIQLHLSKTSEYYECEYRLHHKDGHWVWVLDRGQVVEWSPEGKPLRMFGIHSDITTIKELEDKVQEQAIRDPLTNVYNRRYFFDFTQSTLAECHRAHTQFSIAILDIDHFKAINEHYGQPSGDHLLVDLTRIIGSQIRLYDMQARYGGEEFILLLKGIGESMACAKVEAILNSVRNAIIYHENQEMRFTFSAGVVGSDTLSAKDLNLERIVDLAEKRLAYAKQNGRNCVKASQ